MIYSNIHPAIFLERPNRFIALCQIGAQVHRVHVKNTGRCKELLVPGAKVYLEKSLKDHRKTAYDLISVEKNGHLINMDSQVPNQIVEEALRSRALLLPGMEGEALSIRREYPWQDSRLDFYLEESGKKGLLEVKGVTLEENGMAMFPDAPTHRGIRHIQHLIKAANEGYRAYLLFVIQMDYTHGFMPNAETHPAFAEALDEGGRQGVQIYTVGCHVEPDRIDLLSKTVAFWRGKF